MKQSPKTEATPRIGNLISKPSSQTILESSKELFELILLLGDYFAADQQIYDRKTSGLTDREEEILKRYCKDIADT
ncbi:hypothetical protein N7495_005416 [Penicillium taxi]|uniref:uncharacterized protein n=1 Tax=Penicillium taxi TaxID=168475 RepID=UPI002544F64E|nr:uncharacterized protein N7495_005416 [Penicillium taxi]KAJ5893725.1 hypothetical protein N7495_005416 [Penicillium taxi]